MRMTLRLERGDVDLEVAATSGATIGDLLARLRADGWLPGDGGGAASAATVDGRPAPPDHDLDEVALVDGAVLEVRPRDVAASVDRDAEPTGDGAGTRPFVGDAAVVVGVMGGLDAGRWFDVPAGRHRIGRGADALVGNPTTSTRHATLDVEASGRVTVVDHGSRNGTWIDGRPVARREPLPPGAVLRAGALSLRAEPVVGHGADRATTAAGSRDFNRPPRPAPPPAPELLVPPAQDAGPATARPTLPLASVVGGLAMGAMMYAMTGTPAYAAMAFLMPVLTVVGAVGARRRHGRDSRRRTRDQERQWQQFARRVEASSSDVAARLREVHPDLAEVVRRAALPSVRLWERRLDHDDALHVVLGHATRAWRPPLPDAADGPRLRQVLEEGAWLQEVPVVAGGVVGIVGDRAAALAVARGLVLQSCVHHGPADLQVAVVTPDLLAWDGAKWLPHLRDPATGHLRCAGPDRGRALLDGLLARPAGEDGPARLVVLDGVESCEGRGAPGRAVLRGEAGRVLGVVIAPSVDRLPSSCTAVVHLEGRDGAARVVRPGEGETVRGVLATGCSEATLATTARRLAGLDDPEAADDRDLPARAQLADVFTPAPTDAERVRRRWHEQRRDGRLRVPVGIGPDGPLVVDLAADGPHALVAGTTGAGKSELLRSLVAGLAAGADPDHVAFVLIDYKGGAAFDRCADLPHVAGLVTDLDDDLAERALVCLQAELHRREHLLRRHRVADLDAYRRLDAPEPLPDLVVVIDEFATLATELPDFLDSLVGIAQRGRSLGVHLVLATQRPAGVVSDDIRANTNLRIALRVQDRQDSTDVIEDPAAATLTRDQPGRAFVRLGPGQVVPMQSTWVTGPARRRGDDVRIRPFGLASTPEDDLGGSDTTELEQLVDAVRAAFDAEGLAPPREPWPAPLPDHLDLDELALLDAAPAPTASTVVVGLRDDPANQRRQLAGWDPTEGSLLVTGQVGSGVTSTVAALVTSLCHDRSPADLHVHVLDAGRGGLLPLASLPHASGVVRVGDDERLERLARHLAAELDRRRLATDAAAPSVLLVVDDWESLTSAHDGAGHEALDLLVRVAAEGPAVGITTLLTVTRPGAVTTRLLAALPQRWVLRQADDADGALLGVRGAGRLPVGRALVAPDGAAVQLGHLADLPGAVRDAAARWPAGGGPAPIRRLPTDVDVADLPPPDVRPGGVWHLPVGLRGDDLRPASLALHPGEHALVAGAARSGRSTLLGAVATSAVAVGLPVAHAGGRAGAAVPAGVRSVEPADLPDLLRTAAGPLLVLVDDAELLDLPAMDAALAAAAPDVRIVAAARSDAVRSAYGHWTRALARSRQGVLLDPDVDLDGDLFGVRLPRHRSVPPAPGRGWLVDAGALVTVQAARSGVRHTRDAARVHERTDPADRPSGPLVRAGGN